MNKDAESYSSNGIGVGQFNGSSGKYGVNGDRRMKAALAIYAVEMKEGGDDFDHPMRLVCSLGSALRLLPKNAAFPLEAFPQRKPKRSGSRWTTCGPPPL
jgi:hypothetical protein